MPDAADLLADEALLMAGQRSSTSHARDGVKIVASDAAIGMMTTDRLGIRRIEQAIDRAILDPMAQWQCPAGIANSLHSFKLQLVANGRIEPVHAVPVDKGPHVASPSASTISVAGEEHF